MSRSPNETVFPSVARRRRGNPWLLVGSAVLLLAVLVLAVLLKLYPPRTHFQSDQNLVEELAQAELIEEELAPTSAGWPGWLGPHRDGVVQDPDLLVQWPTRGPKRLWRIDGGQGFSALTVQGSRAYTLLAQDNQESVVCLSATTGKEVWRSTHQLAHSSQFPGPRSTPTLDDDRLYTAGSDGLFHCFDAATGEVRWQHALLEEYSARAGQWGVAFSPLVDGERVYTCPGGRGATVVAFNKHTGEPVWSAGNDRAAYSSPVAVNVNGERQIIVLAARSLLGMSAADGRLLWQQPWRTDYDVNVATPLVFHARSGSEVLTYVFISSGYGKGCGLFKIVGDGAGDYQAQPVYTSSQLCAHFSTPIRHHDHVYGFNESELVCLDLRTGQQCWSHKGFHKGSLLRIDDTMIVLGEQGQLACFTPSPKGFTPFSSCRPLSQRTWTLPSLADGRLYLRDQEQILCLDLRRDAKQTSPQKTQRNTEGKKEKES